jgi:aldehyde dehydrogenase (NAD+)
MINTKNLINGSWIPTDDQTEIFSPTFPTKLIGTICESSDNEIVQAVAAANREFGHWRDLGQVARGNILFAAAARVEAAANMLAEIATTEMGKPIGEARGEALRAAAILRYYAGEGMRNIGEVIPATNPTTLQYSAREPLGVVGIITPWNFPLAIPVWKIAPALVYGNTVVFKPAELSSLTAYKLIELIEDLFPTGVLNLVTGRGSVTGELLIQNRHLNGISFTGSSLVGRHIASAAIETGAKYQLEMGGKNPVIVADDADLDLAIELTVSGAMRSSGQKCTATSRVIVMERILDKFTSKLVEHVKGLKIGDPIDPQTYLGPVVSKAQQEKVLSIIETGKQQGGNLLTGGGIPTTAENLTGYFVAPTVFDNIKIDDTIAQDEIFGPVVAVIPAESIGHAITLANSIRYGLSASIFTNNISTAMAFVNGIKAGLVRVNEETAGVELQAPFGGVKESSSHSREQGRSAIEFYTSIKTVAIRPISR